MLELKYDVAVVGGGVAGLTAAAAAKQEGAGTVVLLEMDSTLGGVLKQKDGEFTIVYENKELRGLELAEMASETAVQAGVDILLRATVMDIVREGKVLSVNSAKGMTYIEAKSIILATGFRKTPFAAEQEPFAIGISKFTPDDKLSRGAGIMMSPVTRGPVVNQYMQTSNPNIFACGNAVHVNHLMDYVLQEGKKAGKYAAQFAMGKFMPARGKIDLETVPGENVTYVCPQKLALCQGKEPIDLFLRVNEPKDTVRLCINCGEKEIFSKQLDTVSPNKMVHVSIQAEDIPAHVGYVVVDVKSKRI